MLGMQKQSSPKFKDYTKAYFSLEGQLTPEKRGELIIAYTPLIKYLASRLASRLPPQVALDDLISGGVIGLIDAIDKFDRSKNVQFKTYAEFRIRGAMLDELRSMDWVPRSIRKKSHELENTYASLEKKLGRPATDEEAAEALHLSLDGFYKLLDQTRSVSFLDIELLSQRNPDTIQGNSLAEAFAAGSRDPFSSINLGQIRDLLAQAIDRLPEKERLTVSLYYYEELTMKEIGKVMGYTESRISQMHSKAMMRLRSKLKKTLVPY
jgi:RNA polymerase sigma factor for flagellar operon FliA